MSEDNRKLEEFGRRAGELLRASADDMDAATRSRLARARATAVGQSAQPRRWLMLRHLAPAGAVAAAALVALVLFQQGNGPDGPIEAAPSTLYDLELLADADAWELSQEADLEFIEWAAAMAELEGAGG